MLAKEIKDAVMTVLLESIQNMNAEDGFCRRVPGWGDVRAQRIMHDNGLRIEQCKVTQHGVKVAVIHRKYAQRKVRLCYKELKPTIEWEE